MRRGILYVFYTWGVILCGVSVLASVAGSLDLDLSRELLVMAALWLMAEGLTVSLPQGQLSAGWAVALTLFLAYGLPAAVWTGGVVTLLGQRLFGQGEPWRTTLFNAGQSVCAFWLANAAYLYVGSVLGNQAPLAGTLQVLAFTGTYYAANHLLVFFFLWPRRRYHPMVLWREALKWDALTYLFTLPLGYLMFLLWEAMTYWAAALLFIPALTLQFVLRLYIVLVLTNRELTALYHVARRLGESVSLEKTLDFVLEAVRDYPPNRL
ncbi:MAG: hypothetical protein QME13_08395, partial [Thermoanaerobacteraceae bacterium]|nr:hypothetical protein [Thermoanaerobacteraceae bacterium]